MSVFYAECAGMYVERGCSRAFTRAAKSKPEAREKIILDGCRKAYCPMLPGSGGLEACRSDFVVDGASVLRAWTPLHGAILEYDTGAYEPQVQMIFLMFYTLVRPEPVPAPSVSVVPSASAAPVPSASGGLAPSASAATP